jgi:muramoyltetrapeptide carboxypeptidase
MTRRELLAGAAVLAAGAAIPATGHSAASKSLKRPQALKRGARIALVAPASEGSSSDDIAKAEAFVAAQGWQPILMPNAKKKMGYLAGTDQERADDLNAAFRDTNIDGIICIRGGYGSMRILPLLDEKMIRRNPKVLMGFSDITALLVGLSRKCGFVTFHGPNALTSDDAYSMESMVRAVTKAEPMGDILQPSPLPSEKYELKTLAPGKAKGRLVGGNLTLLAHLVGTPWAADLKDSILFIEDVSEAPYRLDRMLSHMRLAVAFKRCRGVVVGQFARCDEAAPDSAWKVADVMQDRLSDLGIPVVSGWAIGHVRTKVTLPLGCVAELDADAKTLRVLEAAVS